MTRVQLLRVDYRGSYLGLDTYVCMYGTCSSGSSDRCPCTFTLKHTFVSTHTHVHTYVHTQERYCTIHIHTQQLAKTEHMLYSRFRVFSPDCTLHSAITHVILVLE